jgi:hypothetical protein
MKNHMDVSFIRALDTYKSFTAIMVLDPYFSMPNFNY